MDKQNIELTRQQLLVIINALHEVANDNRSRYLNGEDYEKGVVAIMDDAQEQEDLAEKLTRKFRGFIFGGQ